MNVGDIIKQQLKSRNISIPDLEKLSGLSNADLKNLIYNRSKNLDKLTQVAHALGLSIAQLLPTTLKEPFCYKTYAFAVRTAAHNFKKFHIDVNKETFDEYTTRIYNYLFETKEKTDRFALKYCEGMVQSAIKLGALRIKR